MPTLRDGALAEMTAKGDLLSLNAALQLLRLAVGANDEVLVADSSTPTGFKWASASSLGITGSSNYFFGGNLKTGDAAQHFSGNGLSTSGKVVAIDQDSEVGVTVAGNLKTFAWVSTAADATTVMKVFIDGVLAETVSLTGATGAVSTMTAAVAVGERLAVEFDAGAGPDECMISISVE